MLALLQYLQQYAQYFDEIHFDVMYEQDVVWSNDTLGGLLKK